jgi:hypothetical protein
MKRLNPETNQPFKRGDIREDGFVFDKYNLSAKVKKNGFYQENWLSKITFSNESKKANLRSADWYKNNTERQNKNSQNWRKQNQQRQSELSSKWFAENKDKRAAYEGKRRAMQLQRTPKWDPDAHLIVAKYQLAAMLTKASGIEHHVDHIIPLQGRKVSGLHVFSNLRVIPGSDNVKKSNKYEI